MKTAALAARARPPLAMTRPKSADGLAIASLTAIFLSTALLGLLVAANLQPSRKADPVHIRYRVGATVLDVPSAWLRPGISRSGGQLERLDLVIPWPEDSTEAGPAKAPARSAIERVVLVSLAPADGAVAPSERPMRLYSRFLTAEVWPNPGGLILRRFRPGTPYDEEELYLSPPDGQAFAARCPRGVTPAAIREGCSAELRVGSLDAHLRFAPARLVAWERLAEGVRRVIAGMSVAAP